MKMEFPYSQSDIITVFFCIVLKLPTFHLFPFLFLYLFFRLHCAPSLFSSPPVPPLSFLPSLSPLSPPLSHPPSSSLQAVNQAAMMYWLQQLQMRRWQYREFLSGGALSQPASSDTTNNNNNVSAGSPGKSTTGSFRV